MNIFKNGSIVYQVCLCCNVAVLGGIKISSLYIQYAYNCTVCKKDIGRLSQHLHTMHAIPVRTAVGNQLHFVTIFFHAVMNGIPLSNLPNP